MRFMAMGNFFYNGILREASPAQPRIFDFSDNEIPSVTWRPLDFKARAALVKQAAEIKARSGNVVRIYDIPKEFQQAEVPEVETLEAPPKADPERLPTETVAAISPKAKALRSSGGKRASDMEPD